MPPQHIFMFDSLTVKKLQGLEQHFCKQPPYPLVDGLEPDVLVLDDVIIDCKIKLHGVMNLIGKWDLPTFAVDRMADFVNDYAEFQNRIREMKHENIFVWLPQYGRSFNEMSWMTRPTQIALFIGGEALLNDTACVTVNGVLWDLDRVLEKSCTLCFVSSSTREGKEVIAHSSMHLLGQILEFRFNCLLLGWKIDKYGQFYHDIANIETVDGRYTAVDVTQEDLTTLQTIAEMIISKNFRFDRITVKKTDLAKMFKYSEHRVDQIDEYIPDDTYDTVYRCGIFIDLDLSGVPHVRESSILKGFEVMKDVPLKPRRITRGTVTRVFGRSRPVEKKSEETDSGYTDNTDNTDEKTDSDSTDHADDESCVGVSKEDELDNTDGGVKLP